MTEMTDAPVGTPLPETLQSFEAERAKEEDRWWRENHKVSIHPFRPRLTQRREADDIQALHNHLLTWTKSWFEAKGIAVTVTQEGKQIIVSPSAPNP